MPVLDLSVRNPMDLESMPERHVPVPTDPAEAAEYFTDLMRQILLDEVRSVSAQHVGVCLSGGLDSTFILALLADLRREGEIRDVTAFHYRWQSLRELNSEYITAQDMCDRHGIQLICVDCDDINIGQLLDYHDNLCMPHVQCYHLPLQRTAR